jgi:hypothetical protein
MANRSIPCTTAMILTLLATLLSSPTQSGERIRGAVCTSGIDTGRLTSKQVRIWRAVERIAEAADGAGKPLHPRLQSLWEWAEGKLDGVFKEQLRFFCIVQ